MRVVRVSSAEVSLFSVVKSLQFSHSMAMLASTCFLRLRLMCIEKPEAN